MLTVDTPVPKTLLKMSMSNMFIYMYLEVNKQNLAV